MNQSQPDKLCELCSLDELPEGASRGFCPVAGTDTVFAVRKDNNVRVYVNRCPHQGARLNYRKDHFLAADGATITCYGHGAQFAIDSGECIAGPCVGKFLQRVPVVIDNDLVLIESES